MAVAGASCSATASRNAVSSSELRATTEAYPEWKFVGVDPAAEMFRRAERTIGPHMNRVELISGYVGDAPAGPFDEATCLLTLYFLAEPERVQTVRRIHDRLRPGAPFVAAHVSFPQAAGGRDTWLDRYAAYPIASGADPEQMREACVTVAATLDTFSPEKDKAILRAGGFSDISLFYAAFAWRGWIAHA